MNTKQRDVIKQLGDELDAHLQIFAKKYNLTITMNGGTYTTTSFKPRIEVILGGEDVKQKDFERKCIRVYGAKKEWFNKEFQFNGGTWKVIDIKPRSYKYPIIISNGKEERKASIKLIEKHLK